MSDGGVNDITNNLNSLQFESALTDDEKKLLLLRKRAHALTVAPCAQAVYIASTFNEARQVCARMKHPDFKALGPLVNELTERNPFLVGIIGCGRLGATIANCLLSYAEVNPEELKISTRRPETLDELETRGVVCMYDNAAVAKSAHLLILCCLPSQLSQVAGDICGHLSPQCLVYSLVAGVTVGRLRHLLKTSSVIHADYTWRMDNANVEWDHTPDVSASLVCPRSVDLTCPLSFNKDEAMVETDAKFAEVLVYAMCNMCTHMTLSKEQVVDTVNTVMLGIKDKSTPKQCLKIEDFTRVLLKENKFFPIFDLCALPGRESPLTKSLNYSRSIRQSFIDKYCSIFYQYLHWKNMMIPQRRH